MHNARWTAEVIETCIRAGYVDICYVYIHFSVVNSFWGVKGDLKLFFVFVSTNRGQQQVIYIRGLLWATECWRLAVERRRSAWT